MIKSIRILNKDPYRDMRESALRTMGLRPKTNDAFNPEWIKDSIISRHSQIRCVFFRIDFETVKSVRDQILRSKHGYVEPYVCSARPDKTGKPREANPVSSWYHDFNIEGLLKFAGDRLCTQAEGNTRREIESLKYFMMGHEDPIIKVVGGALAPKCAWYGNCNEFKKRDCFRLCHTVYDIEELIGIYTSDLEVDTLRKDLEDD